MLMCAVNKVIPFYLSRTIHAIFFMELLEWVCRSKMLYMIIKIFSPDLKALLLDLV